MKVYGLYNYNKVDEYFRPVCETLLSRACQGVDSPQLELVTRPEDVPENALLLYTVPLSTDRLDGFLDREKFDACLGRTKNTILLVLRFALHSEYIRPIEVTWSIPPKHLLSVVVYRGQLLPVSMMNDHAVKALASIFSELEQ
jgi:hypothetical protein